MPAARSETAGARKGSWGSGSQGDAPRRMHKAQGQGRPLPLQAGETVRPRPRRLCLRVALRGMGIRAAAMRRGRPSPSGSGWRWRLRPLCGRGSLPRHSVPSRLRAFAFGVLRLPDASLRLGIGQFAIGVRQRQRWCGRMEADVGVDGLLHNAHNTISYLKLKFRTVSNSASASPISPHQLHPPAPAPALLSPSCGSERKRERLAACSPAPVCHAA